MDWIRYESIPAAGQTCMLTADAARHASALRLRSGDAIGLLDGRGSKADGVITSASRTSYTILIHTHSYLPPPADVTVAIGMLDHRERMEFAIEKCTELGVRRIVILDCERSQRHNVRLDRLHQKAEAAMLQCGRAWIPAVEGAMSVADCLSTIEADATVIIGDQYGEAPRAVATPLLVLVGPEGGFSDGELSQIAARDPVKWRIGADRLRTETAAVVLTAAVQLYRT